MGLLARDWYTLNNPRSKMRTSLSSIGTVGFARVAQKQPPISKGSCAPPHRPRVGSYGTRVSVIRGWGFGVSSFAFQVSGFGVAGFGVSGLGVSDVGFGDFGFRGLE